VLVGELVVGSHQLIGRRKILCTIYPLCFFHSDVSKRNIHIRASLENVKQNTCTSWNLDNIKDINPISIKNNRRDISSTGYADLMHDIFCRSTLVRDIVGSKLIDLLTNYGRGLWHAWDRLTDLLDNCGEDSEYAWDRLNDLLVHCGEDSEYAWDRLNDLLVHCGEGSGHAWDRLTGRPIN
jgi:hypothetical protein